MSVQWVRSTPSLSPRRAPVYCADATDPILIQKKLKIIEAIIGSPTLKILACNFFCVCSTRLRPRIPKPKSTPTPVKALDSQFPQTLIPDPAALPTVTLTHGPSEAGFGSAKTMCCRKGSAELLEVTGQQRFSEIFKDQCPTILVGPRRPAVRMVLKVEMGPQK